MGMPTERSRWLVRLAAWVLGVTFLAASISKAIDPRLTLSAFVHVMPESPGLASAATRSLIIAEALLGGLLLSGVARRSAFSVSILLLSVFTAWLVWLWTTGATIRCGCGIDAGWLAPGQARFGAILRNILLLSLAVVGVRFRPGQTSSTSELVGV